MVWTTQLSHYAARVHTLEKTAGAFFNNCKSFFPMLYLCFIICRRAVRIPATVRICSAVYHWFFSCSMISAFNAISTQIIWVCRFRRMEINAAQHVGKGSQWNVVLHFRERSPACRQGLASFSKNFWSLEVMMLKPLHGKRLCVQQFSGVVF